MHSVDSLNAALAGRYTIEREIGAGGMATVYLARDLRHERHVALKVLDPELTPAVNADRFSREIGTTAQLQHPNILPVFDSGSDGGCLWYTMPFIDGESLRARLNRERQLPVDDALRIAREVGEALDYAHAKGIVHRDVKPENILLSQGHAALADFGIARGAGAGVGAGPLTQAGIAMGTPHYMSPEQATAERDVDGRSDLYALACVLFEMLAGEPPFTGSSAQSVVAKHVGATVPSVRTLRPDVSPRVDDAIRRALAKTPASRWPTTEQFVAALGEGGGSRGVSRRTLAAVAAAVVLLVVAAVATSRVVGAGHPRPVVVLMDSPHPRRVYDSTTLAANGTNADVLSDVLADLPIRTQKETIGPSWHREDEVRLFDPDLIVIHFSGFCQEECTDRTRLKQLVEAFADTKTRFLIYSRARDDSLRFWVDTLLAAVERAHTGELRKVSTFGLLNYGTPHWRDPATAAALKLRVKQILELR